MADLPARAAVVMGCENFGACGGKCGGKSPVSADIRVLTTYDLPLTTYDLPLMTYNLRLTTYNLRLTTNKNYSSSSTAGGASWIAFSNSALSLRGFFHHCTDQAGMIR